MVLHLISGPPTTVILKVTLFITHMCNPKLKYGLHKYSYDELNYKKYLCLIQRRENQLLLYAL